MATCRLPDGSQINFPPSLLARNNIELDSTLPGTIAASCETDSQIPVADVDTRPTTGKKLIRITPSEDLNQRQGYSVKVIEYSPSSGPRKRVNKVVSDPHVLTLVPLKKPALDTDMTQPQQNSQNQPGAQRKTRRNRNKVKNNHTDNSNDVSDSEIGSPIQPDLTPIQQGDDHQKWVKDSLAQLTTNVGVLCRAVLGDEKAKQEGVITRLKQVEVDIYGSKTEPKSKGLTTRVTELEEKLQEAPAAAVGTPGTEVRNLQKQVEILQASNAMLVGAASKLQHDNKSLQNQLYVQQDRSNFLNLFLRGVEEIEGASCKAEVVQFFKTILKIPAVSEEDFLKANRRTDPSEYTEELRDGDNVLRLKVRAPGVVFIRVATEDLRELAIAKSRSLGRRRHPTHNHKYFVSQMECEAVKAAKEKNQNRINTILDKNKREGRNDRFHFKGQQFFVNGVLQQDRIKVPTFAEINFSLLHESHILDAIDLYEMEEPLNRDGNQFITYAVRTKRLEVVRWAYIKVYAKHPDAGHVVMAYKLNKQQGSCDDNKYKAGYKILRVLQKKKLRGAAIFVVRRFTSFHHQLGGRRFQIFTSEADSMANFVLNSASRETDDTIPAPSAEVWEHLQGNSDIPSSQEST